MERRKRLIRAVPSRGIRPNLRTERMTSLKVEVFDDGEGAVFLAEHTNREPLSVHFDFADLARVYQAFKYASNAMVGRQRLRVDRGRSKLLEIMTMAGRPAAVDVMVDPMSGDRIILFQTQDGVPVAYRLTPEEIASLLENLIQAVAMSGN